MARWPCTTKGGLQHRAAQLVRNQDESKGSNHAALSPSSPEAQHDEELNGQDHFGRTALP